MFSATELRFSESDFPSLHYRHNNISNTLALLTTSIPLSTRNLQIMTLPLTSHLPDPCCLFFSVPFSQTQFSSCLPLESGSPKVFFLEACVFRYSIPCRFLPLYLSRIVVFLNICCGLPADNHIVTGLESSLGVACLTTRKELIL